MNVLYASIPIGAVLSLPDDERQRPLRAMVALPKNVGDIMFSQRTGAFIRGLAKSYSLPEEKTSIIAFAIVRVAIGELAFSQLAGALAAELSLPNDRAQSMAQEIEKDLFSAVRQELREYWAKNKSQPAAKPTSPFETPRVPPNLLNLKEKPKVIPPPPMPPPI